MLILTRKSGESITIGDDVKITVIEVKGKQVRIGIASNSYLVYQYKLQILLDKAIAKKIKKKKQPVVKEEE